MSGCRLYMSAVINNNGIPVIPLTLYFMPMLVTLGKLWKQPLHSCHWQCTKDTWSKYVFLLVAKCTQTLSFVVDWADFRLRKWACLSASLVWYTASNCSNVCGACALFDAVMSFVSVVCSCTRWQGCNYNTVCILWCTDMLLHTVIWCHAITSNKNVFVQ